MLHLASGVRPTIRFAVPDCSAAREVRAWAATTGFFAADDESYVVVSRASAEAAKRAMGVDRSSGPHTFELGLLLGYPTCCAQAAGSHGEASLDDWASSTASWELDALNDVLNVTGYSVGRSWLSHIPCSPTCAASLDMALRTRRWLEAQAAGNATDAPWNTWNDLLRTLAISDPASR